MGRGKKKKELTAREHTEIFYGDGNILHLFLTEIYFTYDIILVSDVQHNGSIFIYIVKWSPQ